MASRLYFAGGKMMREHIGTVDIYPGTTGYRCLIMVHPKQALLAFFMRGFKQRNLHDHFDTEIRACSISRKCLIFRPIKPFCPSDKMRLLLEYLVKCHFHVIWKEDEFGYEIDALGNIKRSWELDKPAQAALPLEIVDADLGVGGPSE